MAGEDSGRFVKGGLAVDSRVGSRQRFGGSADGLHCMHFFLLCVGVWTRNAKQSSIVPDRAERASIVPYVDGIDD